MGVEQVVDDRRAGRKDASVVLDQNGWIIV
jgi:hypothetical protein